MTHSLDSYITDSANSASALYTGHKSTVNAMGVYVDSSKSPFDDPKVETIVEIFRRVRVSALNLAQKCLVVDISQLPFEHDTNVINSVVPGVLSPLP
jgi:hypothetical protein